MINITRYVVGEVYTNCYLVEDVDTGKLLVIDPGAMSLELINKINEKGGKLDYILLTHGHFDHIGFVHELENLFHPEICVSIDEKDVITSDALNGSIDFGSKITPFNVTRYLENNDTIEFGNSKITFLSTPGHTKGSGIYIVDDIMFSGDTVFYQSVGRTDFPGSSSKDMMESIKFISELEGDYKILPGHERSTTLSYERAFNPFFN